MRVTSVLFAFGLAASPLAAQQSLRDSTWRDHDRAAREARLRGDWASSRAHLDQIDASDLTGHPAMLVALARASAQLGDTARALADLERLAAAGVMHDVEADSQLALVRRSPRGSTVIAKLRANLVPVGSFTPVATMKEVDYVGEGITWDAAREQLLVSSMRHRRIDAVRRDGTISPLPTVDSVSTTSEATCDRVRSNTLRSSPA